MKKWIFILRLITAVVFLAALVMNWRLNREHIRLVDAQNQEIRALNEEVKVLTMENDTNKVYWQAMGYSAGLTGYACGKQDGDFQEFTRQLKTNFPDVQLMETRTTNDHITPLHH